MRAFFAFLLTIVLVAGASAQQSQQQNETQPAQPTQPPPPPQKKQSKQPKEQQKEQQKAEEPPAKVTEPAPSSQPEQKSADDKEKEKKEEHYDMTEVAPVVTHHQITVASKALKYTATAGRLPIKRPDGKIEAEMFFVAYSLDGQDASKRPLTFAFNGGPGSASIWLHMGALGPRRVALPADLVVRVTFKNGAPEYRFDFTFRSFSNDKAIISPTIGVDPNQLAVNNMKLSIVVRMAVHKGSSLGSNTTQPRFASSVCSRNKAILRTGT